MSKTSESQIRAIQKYNKEQTVTVLLRLNKNTDADLIKRLGDVPSKNGYIRELIRKDLFREDFSIEQL